MCVYITYCFTIVKRIPGYDIGCVTFYQTVTYVGFPESSTHYHL